VCRFLLLGEVAAVNSLAVYVNRIWRYRWLVLAITLLASVGALVYTVGQPITYTAESTLTTASKNRSPDQDGYLAESFAEYFNRDSYQGRIRVLAQVPTDVGVSAATGAASPILYIQATGPDPAVAALVAAGVAKRFSDDVQDIANASRDEELARINQRIKDNQTQLNELRRDSDQRSVILSQIFALQQEAKDLRDDTTNQLTELQRDAGVSANRPSPLLNGLLGFAGGLALGCAAALALAVLRNRITTPEDVAGSLGLPTLAVLDRGRRQGDQVRVQRLESLAAAVSLADLPRPATLAITTPRRTSLTSHVAESIVYYQALQGTRSLLLRADLRGPGTEVAAPEATVAGLLAGMSTGPPQPMEIAIGGAEMLVIPSGAPSTADPFALFAPAQFDALLRQLSDLAELIVIEAPPVNEAAESRIICAAADQTVLVVEERVTRAREATRACESLTQVGASMLGAVLGRPVKTKRDAEPFSTVADTVHHPLPTPSKLTAPAGEPLTTSTESDEDTLPQPAANTPQPGTNQIDSPPAVSPAKSSATAAPAPENIYIDTINPPPRRSELDAGDSVVSVRAQCGRQVNADQRWPLYPSSDAQDYLGSGGR
jgi:Mrp family chromosome partitioning ATPase/capsular polysaccharide biosynthesis protein